MSITYHNGAKVSTSFVTNMDGARVRSAPDLYKTVNTANKAAEAENKGKALPKYEYPHEVITAAMVQKWSHRGIEFSVNQEETKYIGALESQKQKKKTIFGGGFLLKAAAAAEAAAAAAAEAAAAPEVWQLSEQELTFVYGVDYDRIDGQMQIFE